MPGLSPEDGGGRPADDSLAETPIRAYRCTPTQASRTERSEYELAGGPDAALEGNAITSLPRRDQERLILELTDYANFLIRTKTRWIPRGVLPQGYDAPGLAMEALSRLLDGRRRPWNPQKEPTLTAYLKSVVKSIFSEILKTAERENSELAAVDLEGRDLVAAGVSTDAGADLELERTQLQEKILGEFHDDGDQLVLICLFEELVKPAEIAKETGLGVADVYRIKQKIKRRLIHLQEGA